MIRPATRSLSRSRYLVALCLLTALSWGSAQRFSVGANVDVGFFPFNVQPPDLSSVATTPTSLGLQITAHRLFDIIGLRGAADVGLATGEIDLGGDLLLSFNLLYLRPYIGLGASTTLTESFELSTHAVTGLELLLMKNFAVYAELDPTLHFRNFPTFEAKLRAGVNLYF